MQNIITVSYNIKIVTINTIHMYINEGSYIGFSKELKEFHKTDAY